MRARKGLMDERADAFLACPAASGRSRSSSRSGSPAAFGLHAKPVVLLDVDGLYAPLRLQLDVMHDGGFLRGPALAALAWAITVAEALDAVEAGLAAPAVLQPLAEEVLGAEP